MTAGFSAVKVTGDLDKGSFHGGLGCKRLTGVGSGENGKRRIRESEDILVRSSLS